MIIEQGWLTLLSPSNTNTCFGRKCIFPGSWNPFQLPLYLTNQNNSRFTCIKYRLRHKRNHHSYSKCSLTWFFKWCQTCFLFNWGQKVGNKEWAYWQPYGAHDVPEVVSATIPHLSSLSLHLILFLHGMSHSWQKFIHSFIFYGPPRQLLCASPPSLFYLSLCIQGQGLAHSRCSMYIFMEINKVRGYLWKIQDLAWKAWAPILALLFTSWATLKKSLYVPGPKGPQR